MTGQYHDYTQRPGVQLEEYVSCFRQQRPTRIPPAGGRFCLLSFYAPSRRAEKAPARAVTPQRCTRGSAAGNSDLHTSSTLPRLACARQRPTRGTGQGVLAGERLTPELRAPGPATSTDLAGPARPQQPSGVERLWTSPSWTRTGLVGRPTRHPPRSSEDTGLAQPPDISLQMTDSDWTCKHDPARAPCSTAARSRQRLLCKCGLATTRPTAGPSKHPSVSRPTRAGPMPRRD